jgi:hypothetical protein
MALCVDAFILNVTGWKTANREELTVQARLWAVESLLLNLPNFLWITRGAPVWGADSALKRFGALMR